ncbi:tRNA pseudouridine55 synthase [Mycoplasmopsis mustelae]|uniref:tRNA pseudouridine(55) synthase n=1 Tax=Mycoplasmopsis mustelae TaxID=171289 RepID=A0A4R7UBS2_9BACT|nr:tRNA pseudouridine(55) synthase TruB [Mycoplasmopsis mustelae]TDV22695.1 tRNA pseudouridine55 synthase [Mycoplasmopsis mustelae]
MFYKFYKPSNVYSNQEIRKLGKKINAKKIGHSGILDQLASGLMIVATDSDTRLLEYLSDKNKAYIVKARFNYSSNTLDTMGEIKKENFQLIFLEDLIKAVDTVSKRKTQIPPLYSAKKINGKRAYNLARNKQTFELKPQNIEVFDYKILDFNFEKQEYTIYFYVSEGTYIRSLLSDIAKELNNASVMFELKRTQVGKIKLGTLKASEFQSLEIDKLFEIPYFFLNLHQNQQLKYGRNFKFKHIDSCIMFLNSNKEVVCVGEVKQEVFYPRKIFLERL